MEKVGRTYRLPCTVNGLPLNFILDTGADEVSISLSEALFML
jgi:predicted aspartyl protease